MTTGLLLLTPHNCEVTKASWSTALASTAPASFAPVFFYSYPCSSNYVHVDTICVPAVGVRMVPLLLILPCLLLTSTMSIGFTPVPPPSPLLLTIPRRGDWPGNWGRAKWQRPGAAGQRPGVGWQRPGGGDWRDDRGGNCRRIKEIERRLSGTISWSRS